MPTWSARLVSRLPRLRLTLPSSVETASFLSSSTASSCSWARPVGVFPEALRGRGFQHLFGAVAGDLAQPPGRGPGEFLGVAGKDFLQFLLDVDVFVELVDQVVAERRRGSSAFWSSRPLVETQSSVLSAWRSIQIAKTLRKARTEPRTTSPLTVRRRPRLIAGMVYVSHEARGHPPHHRDHRERSAQRRLLRRGAGLAAGQENRQPGQPDRLPPLLRRRGRRRRAPI